MAAPAASESAVEQQGEKIKKASVTFESFTHVVEELKPAVSPAEEDFIRHGCPRPNCHA
jgi:hypothetical protein